MSHKKETSSGQCCDTANTSCDETNDCERTDLIINTEEVAPWIYGKLATPVGEIPIVSTSLTFRDTFGSWKARWGIGRMEYKIFPGLYAVGNPRADSPVLVSANYKMSFDRLRSQLEGLNLWILVIDTKGINVWCAAGKGTFGTQELVKRIIQVKLRDVVSHRTLILPQLGAPGVAAHETFKLSGFKVVYGPVRADDIPTFLKAELKATAEMREVRFGILERLVLTPIEIVGMIKPALILIIILFFINLIRFGSTLFLRLLSCTVFDFIPYLGAIVVGTVLVPILLPFIPGRALVWKGWLLGILWAGVYIWLNTAIISWKQAIFYFLLLPPIAAYLAMNFTGATTYTSLSGVVKEMKIALPVIIISAGLGVLLMLTQIFIKF